MPPSRDPHTIPVRLLESEAPARDPRLPTAALPGSAAKLEILIARSARRAGLHHADDCRGDSTRQNLYEEAGNYGLVNTGSVIEVELDQGEKPTGPTTFGGRLAQLRKARGLMRKGLAIRAKLCKAMIGHLERDERLPGLLVLLALADALDVSLDELVGRCRPGCG